jgi:hypothetical protein
MRNANILLALVLLLTLAVSIAQSTPPIADAGPDTTIYLDQFVTLHGTAWDPDSGAIDVWQWELLEGSHGHLSNADMPDAGFSATREGTYILSLYVIDSQLEQSAPDCTTVNVIYNEPPFAEASSDVTFGVSPFTVHFDGTGSWDPEGRPLQYHWDFGDGYSADGPTPSHNYGYVTGEFFAELWVTDDGGKIGWADIIIMAYAPIKSIVDVWYPPDTTITSYSTLPLHVLSGFRICDDYYHSSFTVNYELSVEGPATLVDNGDPASLSGTLIIGYNECHSPPKAALEIPEIREPAQVVVTYHLNSYLRLHDVWFADWHTTTITLEPPVPVFVTYFDAVSVGQSVEVSWNVISDEVVKGFKIYRSFEGSKNRELVNQDCLVPPEVRKYVDNDVRAGHSYDYTLGVVLEDDHEMMSQTVTVKTKAYELILHQNHPNPFNPSTTISFTLPKQSTAKLTIYNVEGRLVTTLLDGTMDEGLKEVTWDGTDSHGNLVSSGVYFYRLKAGGKTLTKKMVLLK